MSDETIHESTETRSRNRIASYLARVSRALGRGERVAADEEQTVTVDPGAEPDLEIEVEESDGTAASTSAWSGRPPARTSRPK